MAATEPASGVRIDAPAVADALRRLEPILGDVETAVLEIGAIAEEVIGGCAAHPSGVVFSAGLRTMTDESTAMLDELRLALSMFADDVGRAADDLNAADADNADSLRAFGSRQW